MYRAKQMTYFDEVNRKTFSVWHPQIKVDGHWCFLPDTDTRSGLVEASDEISAASYAIEAALAYKQRVEEP